MGAARAEVKTDLEHKHALVEKGLSNKLSLAAQERLSAEARAMALETQVTKLQTQLDDAQKRLVEIATTGLNSFGANIANGMGAKELAAKTKSAQ